MARITGQEMLARRIVTEDAPELVDAGVNVGHFAAGLEYKFIKIVRGPIEIASDSLTRPAIFARAHFFLDQVRKNISF